MVGHIVRAPGLSPLVKDLEVTELVEEDGVQFLRAKAEMSVIVLSRIKRHASMEPWAYISVCDRRDERAPDGHGTASSHGDHCRGSS
jgi:hypothetical protein